jgi:hypothetical protein
MTFINSAVAREKYENSGKPPPEKQTAGNSVKVEKRLTE